MAKTIVGLFQRMEDAQAAMNDLDNAGLGANATFAPSREPELHSRLIEAGIPQQDANLYAQGIQQGYPMIVVQGVADQDAEPAAAILDRYNVIDISQLGQNYQRQSIQRTGTSTSTSTGTSSGMSSGTSANLNTNLYEGQDMVVPIIEEQLHVGKRAVEGGGLRIRTSVIETPVTEQVTLREEHVTVDRRPVNQPVDASVFDQVQNQTFEVVEHDEQAVVAKEARVVEEVTVRKDVEQRTETVQDSVRRTNVDVEQLSGQTTTSGTTTGSTMSGTQDEGMIERGLSRAGNAIEGATGVDVDRDGDVGRRDPRNNV
ncbi:MAG: hypothetical protein AVDCRST_MAG93-1669 [uncultured Chloroflexia bacterium]|uniref:DUF2382 domain-containing protein n=1 Tax=uncultured Chloroflexia bacterium TaxID=1672391 RepID=A0A6J4IFT5_9CHLR|nr:MAG: hypothetical protein AVDCRST_MAG93-1669 [uncultured Chloroflexia bacterium]